MIFKIPNEIVDEILGFIYLEKITKQKIKEYYCIFVNLSLINIQMYTVYSKKISNLIQLYKLVSKYNKYNNLISCSISSVYLKNYVLQKVNYNLSSTHHINED